MRLHNGNLWLCLLLLLGSIPVTAQLNIGKTKDPHDTSYYYVYPNRITGRFYFSNKYTIVNFKSSKDSYKLRYEPNTSINIGVGATYKWATLNLGVGFLNRNPAKGRTKYLDLQFHNYGRKFTLDLLGEFYNGFFLFPRGLGSADNSFYRRSDLRVNELGGTAQYVFNHKKFSYRASFIQNEWQKKSAGSFLVGFEIYDGSVRADSSIVPALVNREAAAQNIREVRFVEAGPSVGYVYTLVIRRKYFLTGSVSESLDYSTNAIFSNAGKQRSSGFLPNTIIHAGAGYNSSLWAFSLIFVSTGIQGSTTNQERQLSVSTGNYRINLVRRFVPRSKTKNALQKLVK